MDTSVLLAIHKHPLTPSARFIHKECWECFKVGPIYGGYHCTECNQWFHKECAEAPSEIDHFSHPQHPLKWTFKRRKRKCGLCGVTGWQRGYECSLCDFQVDLTCARKSPESPHILFKEQEKLVPNCEVCNDTSEYDPSRIHEGCANLPQQVNHVSHPKHTLKLVTMESLSQVLDETSCLLCGEAFDEVLYHCSICNFTLCPLCGKTPPPLTIQHPKTHEHQLTRWPRHISFTCNKCGMQGVRSPYICFQCDFMVHEECVGLPRVININRHDHRVSFTNRVGLANSKCGVCRKSVNQYYGGYSCSTCLKYVVHSQCAVREGVWDFIELEGNPEDIYIPPYIVVGENLIKHFSHEKHYLQLNKDDVHDS